MGKTPVRLHHRSARNILTDKNGNKPLRFEQKDKFKQCHQQKRSKVLGAHLIQASRDSVCRHRILSVKLSHDDAISARNGSSKLQLGEKEFVESSRSIWSQSPQRSPVRISRSVYISASVNFVGVLSLHMQSLYVHAHNI